MRHIAYTATLVRGEKGKPYTVEVRITEQTHRQAQFSTNPRIRWGTDCFHHKRFYIHGGAYPWYNAGADVVFVRGYNKNNDNDKIILPLATYRKFKAAVQAYNEYHKED